MKRLKNILTLFVIIGVLVSSCEYKEIVDADYTPQKIYMPSAVSGIYMVNDTNDLSGKYRYKLDLENNKLIIPLGVYRSGIDSRGSVNVDLIVNNDTIDGLNEVGALDNPEYKMMEVIPDDKYSIPGRITIPDGSDNVTFDLSIDLDYLATQPDKRLGLGVEINSTDVEVDRTFNLTVLELTTNFIVPTANFSVSIDSENDRKYIFTNLSSYAKECIWDFGDGVMRSTTKDTVHHYYSDYSEYNVTMTVKGITMKPVKYELPIKIWQNITKDYIKNPGNPFLRSDDRTSVVGNLADWLITDNLKTTKSGGKYYGGYVKNIEIDGEVYMGVMDFFSPDAVLNGKIWQTIQLPAGSYRMTAKPIMFTGENDCYFAVVKGKEMPDAENMESNTVINKLFFNSITPNEDMELNFVLNEPMEVTLGFVVNTQAPPKGVFNELVIQNVGLYK